MYIFRGVLFTFCLSGAVQYLHFSLPSKIQSVLGSVVLGVLVGLIINNFLNPKDWLQHYRPGIKFCFDKLLKFSIVLLGLRISFSEVLKVGGSGLILILCTITVGWGLAHYLGKWTKTPTKLAALIGIGTAVCGNTAISATGPAIGASDEEISFAIATNTLFGTIAVFTYPILGHWMGLSDSAFGFWAGSAVNDTSQVIATAFSFSDAAGEIATTVKLTRNSLMGFVILIATAIYSKNSQSESKRVLKIPGFVLLFVLVAILNSLGLFHWIENEIVPFLFSAKVLTGFLILMALTAVGLNTNLKAMKSLGLAPLLIGVVTAVIVSILSLSLISLFDLGIKVT